MIKNQFLKITGLKSEHRLQAKPYLDIVARYKGRLSYRRLLSLAFIAISFGRRGPDEIISYVDAVMSAEVSGYRSRRQVSL